MEFFIIFSLRSVQKVRQKYVSQSAQSHTSIARAGQVRVSETEALREPEENGNTLYSAVVPFKDWENYAFLVLGDINSAFQLSLEKGKKNDKAISISLYKNEALYDSLSLHRRLDWKLACLDPGCYLLKLDETAVFRFQIKA